LTNTPAPLDPKQTGATPLDLFNVPKHTIEFRVSSKDVTQFLHIVYQELQSIAPVAMQPMKPNHRLETNLDIFAYIWLWSHRDNDFIAYIDFIVHANKGVQTVSIAAINSESKIPMPDIVTQIEQVLKYCAKKLLRLVKKHSKPYNFATVLRSRLPLSGTYKTDFTTFFPVISDFKHDSTEYLTKCTAVVSGVSEPIRLGLMDQKAEHLASALTLATQNLFSPLFKHSEFTSDGIPVSSGIFFDDKQMFKKDSEIFGEGPVELNKIFDMFADSDLHINNQIILPKSIAHFIRVILENNKLTNAALCFRTALELRELACTSKNYTHTLLNHESVAYASAIEALLSSDNKVIPCPHCEKEVNCGIGNTTQNFKSFIQHTSEGNSFLIKLYSELYNLRSRFLHEGQSLYRIHQPILYGPPVELKMRVNHSPYPQHYEQLHNYTGWLIRRHIYWNFLGKLSC
jgi:hypothetical protein